MRSLLFVSLAACSGKTDTTSPTGDTGTPPTTGTDTGTPPTTDTDPPDGLCGDPTEYNLQVTGQVTGPSGNAPEAVVTLEDRAWSPGILAQAYTDAEGRFTLDVVGLTGLEDCWGLLDYVVVAEKGTFYGEKDINNELFNAIDNGTMLAELGFPIEMEDTSQ